MDQRVVRNLTVARDVFEAGQLIREHCCQQVLRFHPLQRRRDFSPAALPGQSEGARGVPAPPDGKHRRIQQRLHQQLARGLAVQIAEDFVERERMLRAER